MLLRRSRVEYKNPDAVPSGFLCYPIYMTLARFDKNTITIIKIIANPLARAALFIIFFWFGVLKILNISPADPLVAHLLYKTLPFVSFDPFRIFFGFYEMAIGIACILPRAERLAIALLIPHMIAAFLPLILLPHETWTSLLAPTFEGQYIIKNVVIVALALSLAAHLHPIKKK